MERLNFGMGPVALGAQGAELRRGFAKFLADALGMKVTIVATQSYSRLLRRAAAQDLHLAWLPPALYVRIADHHERSRLLLGCVRTEPGYYHGALFVRPDSDCATPEALAGCSLAWVDPNSCAGYLFPRFALLSRELAPDTLFASERFCRSHEAVVRCVRDGEVDAGAGYVQLSGKGAAARVVGSSWQGLGEQMRTLLTSRAIPSDVICKVGSVDESIIDTAVEALAHMHESARGAAVLSGLLQVQRFEPARAADYAVVRSALNIAHLPVLGED